MCTRGRAGLWYWLELEMKHLRTSGVRERWAMDPRLGCGDRQPATLA